MFQRAFVVRKCQVAIILCALIPLFAACNGDKATTVVVNGRAIVPGELSGPLGAVPVANSSFQVLNLDGGTANPVAFGATDADGNFAATIAPANAVAVVVTPPAGGALGAVRVSGLIDSRDGSVTKDFNGVTDLACEAGVTAVLEGAVAAFRMDEGRIANLEAGAAVVAATQDVDYTDAASVSAGAAQVRALTNDGDHAPSDFGGRGF